MALQADVFIPCLIRQVRHDELKHFVAEQLTNYKRPKFIEFRDELPKTPVGKILRRALRDEPAKQKAA